MSKNGLCFTPEQCSSKWKSLRNRYQKINNRLTESSETGQPRKTPWPFYEKMNKICGQDDSVSLKYIEEVGAGGMKKRKGQEKNEDGEQESRRVKKMRTRTTNVESLGRLIEIERTREKKKTNFSISLESKKILLLKGIIRLWKLQKPSRSYLLQSSQA